MPFNLCFSKRKTTEDQRPNGRDEKMNGIASDGDSDTNTESDTQLTDGSVKSHDSMESDSDVDVKPTEDGSDYEDNKSDEYNVKKEDENDEIGDDDKTDQHYIDSKDDDEDGDGGKADRPAEFNIKMDEGDECDIKKEDGSEDGDDCKDEKACQNHVGVENDDAADLSNPHKKIVDPSKKRYTTTRSKRQTCHAASKSSGFGWGMRVSETSRHPVAATRSPGMKNRLRQRPTRNTAMESIVVPDSEDGVSSEKTNSNDIPEGETSSPTADDPEEDDSDC